MSEGRLPILLSVPHAGLDVPDYLRSHCLLTPEQIEADGDVGAREIYALETEVAGFVTTNVARAIVDMNRPTDDWSKDGVVKTHTCWDEEIYSHGVPPELLQRAIEDFHVPYHRRLSSFAEDATIRAALDCHTMAEFGPPVGPDHGQERPLICLGDGDGTSCRREWVEGLRDCLEQTFAEEVTINRPFRGGWITRHHGREMPWIQVELSRTARFTRVEKRKRFLAAVAAWCSVFLAAS